MKSQGTKIIHRKHHKKLFMKRRFSKELHQQRLALKFKTCMYVLGSLSCILKFYSKQKVCMSRLILQQVIFKLKLPIRGRNASSSLIFDLLKECGTTLHSNLPHSKLREVFVSILPYLLFKACLGV